MFKQTWDQEMVEAHGEHWAELFAQLVQNVLNDLGEGRSNSLSVFMHNETHRSNLSSRNAQWFGSMSTMWSGQCGTSTCSILKGCHLFLMSRLALCDPRWRSERA